MEIRRFLSHHPAVNNRVIVTGDELFHLITVNRAKTGDPIEVINGRGSLYSGTIRAIKGNEAVVDITREEKRDKPAVRITIAPSLIKKRTMNLLVEKLSEMGVDAIRPVIFTRTDEKYNPSLLTKWERIALQSLKVNKKLWPTEIYPPVSLQELLDIPGEVKTKLLLHVDGEAGPPSGMSHPVISIIGPPGDFLPEERELLVKNGFIQYNINDGILKTETAAISIAAILKGTMVTEQ